MISALPTCSPARVSPASDGWYGMPSRHKLLLAKTIAQLNAASLAKESVPPLINPKYLHEMVAERAYYKAEQRGFEPGHELEDWLEAERELLCVPAYFLD